MQGYLDSSALCAVVAHLSLLWTADRVHGGTVRPTTEWNDPGSPQTCRVPSGRKSACANVWGNKACPSQCASNKPDPKFCLDTLGHGRWVNRSGYCLASAVCVPWEWDQCDCCPHSFVDTMQARKILRGKHLLILGWSTARRHMWAMVDQLGGENATRRMLGHSTPGSNTVFDRRAVQEGNALYDFTMNNHIAQVVIVDLSDGRFKVLHQKMWCGGAFGGAGYPAQWLEADNRQWIHRIDPLHNGNPRLRARTPIKRRTVYVFNLTHPAPPSSKSLSATLRERLLSALLEALPEQPVLTCRGERPLGLPTPFAVPPIAARQVFANKPLKALLDVRAISPALTSGGKVTHTLGVVFPDECRDTNRSNPKPDMNALLLPHVESAVSSTATLRTLLASAASDLPWLPELEVSGQRVMYECIHNCRERPLECLDRASFQDSLKAQVATLAKDPENVAIFTYVYLHEYVEMWADMFDRWGPATIGYGATHVFFEVAGGALRASGRKLQAGWRQIFESIHRVNANKSENTRPIQVLLRAGAEEHHAGQESIVWGQRHLKFDFAKQLHKVATAAGAHLINLYDGTWTGVHAKPILAQDRALDISEPVLKHDGGGVHFIDRGRIWQAQLSLNAVRLTDMLI